MFLYVVHPVSHYSTLCSYLDRNGGTLLKKGGVQTKHSVDVGEAGVDGHGRPSLGEVPGNSTWLWRLGV